MSESQLQFRERPKDATPWAKRSPNFTSIIIFSSIIPVILFLAVLNISELSGAGALLTVFLPLQLLAAAIAAIVTRGRRGVADSQLSVFVYVAVFL